MSKRITILGSGLSGPLLATFLARRGYQIDLYEKRDDMRKTSVERGRSINLALSTRGIAALKAIGIDKEILGSAIPMYSRMIHTLDGDLESQPYGKDGQAINSVSRSGLNIELMNIAEREPNLKIHFDFTCKEVHLNDKVVILENNKTDEIVKKNVDILIGTDGSNSSLRHSIESTGVNTKVVWLEHGYKELTIPAGINGEFLLEKNSLHIWPRHEFMMIALPNPDATFTLTLFAPWEGENGLNSIKTDDDVLRYFNIFFKDAVPLMPTLLEDWNGNPPSTLATVRCDKWYYEDWAFLLGDAAHAVVPFYGQGMNCCFEDCLELDNIISKILPESVDEWCTVIEKYFENRKPNADAIADLALQNFVEMRSKVINPKFIKKKEIDNILFDFFPEFWVPLYTMVTFSTIPYSDALNRSIKQDNFLEKIGYENILNEINKGKDSLEKFLKLNF